MRVETLEDMKCAISDAYEVVGMAAINLANDPCDVNIDAKAEADFNVTRVIGEYRKALKGL
tara:strand:- start:337 stop:519 length:183 start_codon:yes stop_codon:yes gene_type:complete